MNTGDAERIIEEVTESIYEAFPDLLERYGEAGKNKCREDNAHHFKQLKAAAEMKKEQFFTDYALWLDTILTNRGMKTWLLIDNFQRLKEAVSHSASPMKGDYLTLLQAGIGALERKPEEE